MARECAPFASYTANFAETCRSHSSFGARFAPSLALAALCFACNAAPHFLCAHKCALVAKSSARIAQGFALAADVCARVADCCAPYALFYASFALVFARFWLNQPKQKYIFLLFAPSFFREKQRFAKQIVFFIVLI